MFQNQEILNLRPDDRNFKLKRSFRGYDPRQADEKINELYAQIDALAAQNRRLNGTVGEFDEKICALAESTNKMQQEHIQEKMRLAKLLTDAEKIAEETVAKAKSQAEQILLCAKLEAQKTQHEARQRADALHRQTVAAAAGVQGILKGIERSLLAVRHAGERYSADLSAAVHETKGTWPESPPAAAPEAPPMIPCTPDQLFVPLDIQADSPEPEAIDFDAVLRQMGLGPIPENHVISRSKVRSPGRCVGHFGD